MFNPTPLEPFVQEALWLMLKLFSVLKIARFSGIARPLGPASWKSSYKHYSSIGQSKQPQAGSGDSQAREVGFLGHKSPVSDMPLNCLSLENMTRDKPGECQAKS